MPHELEKPVRAARSGETRLVTDPCGVHASRSASAAWRRARPRIDGAGFDAQEKGREALGGLRDVTDTFVDAVDNTTLALFAALASVLAATRRR